MKKIKQIWIVLGLMVSLNLGAQTLARMPEAQMRSTSVMVGSGSTLPSAASYGAVVTGEQLGTYTPANAPSRPKRAKMGEDDWEDDEFSETDEPWKDPIGDAALPLALMAAAYALLRVYRCKRARV